MSQSPVRKSEIAETANLDSQYRQGLRHLNQLVDAGGSLSGHERNCAFLNTRRGSFANISSVSGFDYVDDARALAVTDWDSDGDLDVWVSNRTSPRVRFLQNQTVSEGQQSATNFISVRLHGVNCNRDAIGSRVTLELADGKIVKGLRAGEGFLGQSSKRLHFGVGEAKLIDKLVVRWPHGGEQTFRKLPVNQHYVLVEGKPTPSVWTREESRLAINAQPQRKISSDFANRIVLGQPIPVPALKYQPLTANAGEEVVGAIAGPVLVNLWAPWCGPCMAELAEFQSNHDALRNLGLQLVAVSIDQSNTGTPDEARQKAEQLGLKFDVGVATKEFLSRLDNLQRNVFGPRADLPVPTSFLLDRERRLVVVYRGPIDVAQLEADVQAFGSGQRQHSPASYAASGVWHQPPKPVDMLQIPRDLMDRGHTREALGFVERYRAELAHDDELPMLLVWIGDALIKDGDGELGITQYRRALSLDNEDLLALNNLAWQLATHDDAAIRDGAAAVKFAQQAARQTDTRDAGVLDTLAAAYAELGKFEAAKKVIDRAILISKNSGQDELLIELQKHRRKFELGQPIRTGGASGDSL